MNSVLVKKLKRKKSTKTGAGRNEHTGNEVGKGEGSGSGVCGTPQFRSKRRKAQHGSK